MGETRFAAVIIVTAGSLLTGCETLSDVNGSDYHASTPLLRIAWNVGGSPGSGPPIRPHSSRAIEMSLAHSSGEATQGLAAGQPPIRFGGVQIDPPQTIQERFTISTVGVAYRWRRIFGTIGLEYFIGMGYREFDMTLDTGTQLVRNRHDGAHVPLGLGLIWNIAPRTSLQLRNTTGIASSFLFERQEIAVAQSLTRNAALRVGWMAWDVQKTFDFESDVRFKLAGPALGLDWEF